MNSHETTPQLNIDSDDQAKLREENLHSRRPHREDRPQ
jgi:hypothetical protein